MSDPESPEKRHGCFFQGCLTAIALVLALGIGGFLMFKTMVRKFNEAMLTYTDTAPQTLPKVDMPAAELSKLQQRVVDWGNGLEAHTNAGPLVLTDREVNALIEQTPQAQELHLKDHLYVTFESNLVKAQVSLPMTNYVAGLSALHTQGRYFNGVATLAATFTNAALAVKVKSVETRGKELPAKFIGVLQDWGDQFILLDVNDNPTNSVVLTNIESAVITNDTVVITPK